MDQKVVWITGASSGIGAAVAQQYSDGQHMLVLSSRNQVKLKAVRESLPYPDQAIIYPMDVSEYQTIPEHYAAVKSQVGTIDILVNNAGRSQRGRALETDIEVDKALFDLNFFGNIALTKAVLPDMIAQGSGHIVVISSLAGKLSTAYRSTYAATKHALVGYYDAVRAEVGDHGVEVHMIYPGYVKTDISVNAIGENGETHGIMDENQENGISAETCAKEIKRAVAEGKNEKFIGGKEVHYIKLRNFLPSVYHKVLRKKAREQSF